MANVKFYRLGLNGGVSNASYLEYTNTTDGRIVFALVKGENANDPLEHYIWANGIEYHVADASALLKIEHTLNVLLDGAPVDTSIGKMIQDALDGYELTAENFVKLVDSSNSNVQVRVVDSSIVLTAPGSHANITVGTVSPEDAGLTPTHGDYYVKEEVITEKPDEEPRRTAYIYNADLEKWQALDGNVDATNVFFKDGVDRTAAIGVLPATEGGAVENEGRAMNLKDLLEYYLVEEIYKGNADAAKLNTPSWQINASGGTAIPNDLHTYVRINNTAMSSNSSLVEVGSTVTIGTISISTTPTHTGTSSVDGTAAKISDMFKYSTDGTTTSIVDNDSSTGTTPSVTFKYSTNFDTANASLSLKSSNSSIFSNSSANGLMTSSISLDASSGTLSEGTLTMTLSYSNDASASRTINSSVTATTVSVYPVSNKNNVSTGTLTANGLIPTDSFDKATNNITKANTTITINAVYPIYANASIGASSGTDESFVWHNWSMEPKEKLPLRRVSDTTGNLYFYVGNNSGGDASKKLGVYIPKLLKIQVSSTNILVPDVDALHNYTSDSFGLVSGVLYETIDTSINSVPYTLYELSGIGATCFKLTLENKN